MADDQDGSSTSEAPDNRAFLPLQADNLAQNEWPRPPGVLTNEAAFKPRKFNLHGQETYDLLNKQGDKRAALKEFETLTPCLFYLNNVSLSLKKVQELGKQEDGSFSMEFGVSSADLAPFVILVLHQQGARHSSRAARRASESHHQPASCRSHQGLATRVQL